MRERTRESTIDNQSPSLRVHSLLFLQGSQEGMDDDGVDYEMIHVYDHIKASRCAEYTFTYPLIMNSKID